MFPSAVSRLFNGNSSKTTSTIGGVRSIVCTAAADSDGRKFCLTPGSRRKSVGTTSAAGASAVRNCRTIRHSTVGERHGEPDERTDHDVPRRHENFAPPEPRHHESCRQERHHDAVKRRGCAPADRSNRTLDREQHERNSETNGEHRRDSGQPGSCSWPGRTLDCSTPPRRSAERWRSRRARATPRLVRTSPRGASSHARRWQSTRMIGPIERLRRMERIREGPVKTVLRRPAKMRTAITAPYRAKSREGSDRSDTRRKPSERVRCQSAGRELLCDFEWASAFTSARKQRAIATGRNPVPAV